MEWDMKNSSRGTMSEYHPFVISDKWRLYIAVQIKKWETDGGRMPKDITAYPLYHIYSFDLSVGVSYLNWLRHWIANFISIAIATNGIFIVIWGQYKWEKKKIVAALEQSLVGHRTMIVVVILKNC